jgi:hypothetical protein
VTRTPPPSSAGDAVTSGMPAYSRSQYAAARTSPPAEASGLPCSAVISAASSSAAASSRSAAAASAARRAGSSAAQAGHAARAAATAASSSAAPCAGASPHGRPVAGSSTS